MLVTFNSSTPEASIGTSLQTVALFGSTGSIGSSTLSVIEDHLDRFAIEALIAGSNIDTLLEQVTRWEPKVVGISDASKVDQLKLGLQKISWRGELLIGSAEIAQYASTGSYGVMVAAIVGSAGLQSVFGALKSGKRVALANKESLVCAGPLMKSLLHEYGGSLIPIDSEHSAIYQALQGEDPKDISKVILTASGGPFRRFSKEQLSQVTIQQALNHPRWKMGPKITIDSATLYNKALEVLEAYWLYGVAPDQIEVVVHPQSIIHSMVEFCDGSTIAQLSNPDMRGPIAYALGYPGRRLPGAVKSLDWKVLSALEFEQVDTHRFPSLSDVQEVLNGEGWSGVVLNAANEEAVAVFLKGRISFIDIFSTVRRALDHFGTIRFSSLEELCAIEETVREHVKGKLCF